jgi:hypothetical protein
LSGSQLLSNDPTEDFLKGLLLALDVSAKGVIEHRLVVTPTLFLYLRTEPIDYVTVKSNGDPNFLS